MNSPQIQNKASNTRRAYTLAEVAEMFGKHRSWVYRQSHLGRMTTITGYGVAMVSEQEVRRLLGKSENEEK